MNKDHLKEAAKDIRTNLEYAIGMTTDIFSDVRDTDVRSTLTALEYRLKNVERALTRIDMALKDED